MSNFDFWTDFGPISDQFFDWFWSIFWDQDQFGIKSVATLDRFVTIFWRMTDQFRTDFEGIWTRTNLGLNLTQLWTDLGPVFETLWTKSGQILGRFLTNLGLNLNRFWADFELDRFGTKFWPITYQIWTKSGPNRDQIGTKSGPNRDQIWTKSGPIWDQFGIKNLDRFCTDFFYYFGTNLDRFGTKLRTINHLFFKYWNPEIKPCIENNFVRNNAKVRLSSLIFKHCASDHSRQGSSTKKVHCCRNFLALLHVKC